jgi:hypothetical protein
MIVISDASPLVSLARIDRLQLLPDLYRAVLIPDAVWNEVVELGAGEPGAKEVERAQWVKRCQVDNVDLVKALRQELDAGEAEAIALALEANGNVVLMDERMGREVAHHFGVQCTGTLGVLIEAKNKGMLDAVGPCLDKLIADAEFRVSDTLYRRVLEEAGE